LISDEARFRPAISQPIQSQLELISASVSWYGGLISAPLFAVLASVSAAADDLTSLSPAPSEYGMKFAHE
jgi:hypothetical protein